MIFVLYAKDGSTVSRSNSSGEKPYLLFRVFRDTLVKNEKGKLYGTYSMGVSCIQIRAQTRDLLSLYMNRAQSTA